MGLYANVRANTLLPDAASLPLLEESLARYCSYSWLPVVSESNTNEIKGLYDEEAILQPFATVSLSCG